MSSYNTIETPQDYVNYTFNITSRGVTEVTGELAGLSNTVTTILGQFSQNFLYKLLYYTKMEALLNFIFIIVIMDYNSIWIKIHNEFYTIFDK